MVRSNAEVWPPYYEAIIVFSLSALEGLTINSFYDGTKQMRVLIKSIKNQIMFSCEKKK